MNRDQQRSQRFYRWLRIIFPEIQLRDLVREQGWIQKNKPKPSANVQNVYQPQRATHLDSLPVGSPASGGQSNPVPSTAAAIRQQPVSSAYDSHRTLKSPDLNIHSDRIDLVFSHIEQRLRQSLLEQDRFISQLIAAYKRAYLAKKAGVVQNTILLAGPHGTGKRKALTILINELYQHKFTPTSHYTEINLARYEPRDLSSRFAVDCAAAFQNGMGTVCFTGMEAANSEVLSHLSQLATEGVYRTPEGTQISAADYFIIIYMDQSMDQPIEQGEIPPSIAGNLPHSILQCVRSTAITRSLSIDSLEIIADRRFHEAAQRLAEQTQLNIYAEPTVFTELAKMAMESGKYGEAVDQWIEQDFTSVMIDMRARGDLRAGDDVTIRWDGQQFMAETAVLQEVLKFRTIVPEESIEDVLVELESLTGLEPIKRFVHELMETAQIQKRRALAGHKTTTMSKHMIFTGNPGTGKTTVARLISRLLKAMGLLSQGQLVEVARQDLVGEYVGATAPKTMVRVKEALGGVLFIDEAYTLSRNQHDSFGLEAIDTLVKAMEDHRDDLVVILAGYTKEMEQFLESNPGLRSRFPFIVEFPDYTSDEMLNILQQMAQSREYRIEAEAHEGLLHLFEQRQIPGRNDSGNGRLVRNLLEEAIRKQATRVGATLDNPDELQLLQSEDFGIGRQETFNIEAELARIVGLERVKAFIRTLEKQMMVNRRRKEAGIEVDTGQTLNMVYSGNPGTGKTTMARLVSQMLKSLGYLKKGHLVEVDRSDLVAEYVGQTATKTTKVVESALGGVLFIDEAYALVEEGPQGGGFGKEAIDTLVRLIEQHRENLVVILAGYTDEMDSFMRVNPGLASRFPMQIEFPDYSPEEMEQITELMAKSRGFVLEDGLREQLILHYESKQIPGKKDGGNGRLVRNTLENAIRNQSVRLADHADLDPDQLKVLTAADFQMNQRVQEPSDSALNQLENIIGLEPVKHFVRSISAQLEVAQRRKELGLPQAGIQTLHMIFKGNPGTGKTTIARILACRLKELGVVKSDVVVETDRSGLVAGYVGQTALKTKEVIDKALGGVLFIDEAYALVGGSNDFGQEAIDTLVKAMDDYRDRLIVILAGYDEDMERFLDSNAGLRSRFPNVIRFPDYTAEEMLQIARVMLNEQGYRCSAEAEKQMLSLLKQYEGDITSGNGRLVRNLCEKAIRSHALRLSGHPDVSVEALTTLQPEDFHSGGING